MDIGRQTTPWATSNYWALQTLAEEGYRYDSSIYPIHHDTYGIPDALVFPSPLHSTAMDKIEFSLSGSAPMPYALCPMPSIVEFLSHCPHINMISRCGGVIQLFPYRMVRGVSGDQSRKRKPAFYFYLHPGDRIFEQPRMRGLTPKSRFRTITTSRGREEIQIHSERFQFTSIREIMESGFKAAERS